MSTFNVIFITCGCGCGVWLSGVELWNIDISLVLVKSWNEDEKKTSDFAEAESTAIRIVSCESQSDLRCSPSWIRNMFESLGLGETHSLERKTLLQIFTRWFSHFKPKWINMNEDSIKLCSTKYVHRNTWIKVGLQVLLEGKVQDENIVIDFLLFLWQYKKLRYNCLSIRSVNWDVTAGEGLGHPALALYFTCYTHSVLSTGRKYRENKKKEISSKLTSQDSKHIFL